LLILVASRSNSCRALSASSRDFRILSWRLSSASSSGRQAKLCQQRQQNEKRHDGPNKQAGIRLNQRIIH